MKTVLPQIGLCLKADGIPLRKGVLGIGLQEPQALLNGGWLQQVIAIELNDIGGPGRLKTGITGGAQAAIVTVVNHANTRLSSTVFVEQGHGVSLG